MNPAFRWYCPASTKSGRGVLVCCRPKTTKAAGQPNRANRRVVRSCANYWHEPMTATWLPNSGNGAANCEAVLSAKWTRLAGRKCFGSPISNCGRIRTLPPFSPSPPLREERAGVRRHKVLRLKSPLPARAGRGRPGQCQDATPNRPVSRFCSRWRGGYVMQYLNMADSVQNEAETGAPAQEPLTTIPATPSFWSAARMASRSGARRVSCK